LHILGRCAGLGRAAGGGGWGCMRDWDDDVASKICQARSKMWMMTWRANSARQVWMMTWRAQGVTYPQALLATSYCGII